MSLKTYVKKGVVSFFIFSLIFLSCFIQLFAKDIIWTEVAKTNNEIQFIDAKSINYNKRGLLTFITKYSEINPNNQNIINTNSYLMAVDCEERLFSKLPLNGELKQVKNWKKPTNDKLIKKTIINSCSY